MDDELEEVPLLVLEILELVLGLLVAEELVDKLVELEDELCEELDDELAEAELEEVKLADMELPLEIKVFE